MKSIDFRRIARSNLDSGGWTPFICGFLFNAFVYLIVLVVTTVLQGVAKLWFKSGAGVEAAKSIDQVLMYAGKYALVLVIVLLIRMYFEAVIKYGHSSLAMAVMRRGATFGHALSGYGRGWRTTWLYIVSGMYVFLWSLLLIVPGIRAAYSYRMMFFLRIDHPELRADSILAESKRLMDGNRWRLFCLDISFIGWWLLCICTLGLAAVFVFPYYMTANAAFYEDLLDKDEAGELRAEGNQELE